tara:strand:+ start:920 stop:1147 length:228 start_codon:yes stop_codon:yes gene_type:complete
MVSHPALLATRAKLGSEGENYRELAFYRYSLRRHDVWARPRFLQFFYLIYFVVAWSISFFKVYTLPTSQLVSEIV